MTDFSAMELKVFSQVIDPTEHHKGWVELVFADPTGQCPEDEIREIVSQIQDSMLPEFLHGFRENGGVFEYDPKYFGIDFIFSVPETIKRMAANSPR